MRLGNVGEEYKKQRENQRIEIFHISHLKHQASHQHPRRSNDHAEDEVLQAGGASRVGSTLVVGLGMVRLAVSQIESMASLLAETGAGRNGGRFGATPASDSGAAITADCDGVAAP